MCGSDKRINNDILHKHTLVLHSLPTRDSSLRNIVAPASYTASLQWEQASHRQILCREYKTVGKRTIVLISPHIFMLQACHPESPRSKGCTTLAMLCVTVSQILAITHHESNFLRRVEYSFIVKALLSKAICTHRCQTVNYISRGIHAKYRETYHRENNN